MLRLKEENQELREKLDSQRLELERLVVGWFLAVSVTVSVSWRLEPLLSLVFNVHVLFRARCA